MKLPTRPETFACHPAEVAGDGFFPVHEPHISANEYPHNQMKSIQIGDLKITLPIIQGGMGVGISLSGLASAVANEGGVGVISCAGIGLIYPKFSNDYRTNSIMGLREEIRKARAKTSGVIGVNIMVALSNFADMVRTAIEEKADIIFSGAGLPLDLPSYLGEKSSTKLVPIVSSARAAHIICEKWNKNTQIEDDNFSLERLIPEVVATADRFAAQHAHPIPVIAAGGLYTGEDIYRIMSLGAAGVQMGSIFVTTTECDASETFKKTYIESSKEDIEIIASPVGMPGRAIGGEFLRKVKAGLTRPKRCPFHCIKTCDYTKSPYCIILALYNAAKGNLSRGYAFAGANAYLSKKITSVKETIESLKAGFQAAAGRNTPAHQ